MKKVLFLVSILCSSYGPCRSLSLLPLGPRIGREPQAHQLESVVSFLLPSNSQEITHEEKSWGYHDVPFLLFLLLTNLDSAKARVLKFNPFESWLSKRVRNHAKIVYSERLTSCGSRTRT